MTLPSATATVHHPAMSLSPALACAPAMRLTARVAPARSTPDVGPPVVAKAVGDSVEESWMISDENAGAPVAYLVGQFVEKTWTNLVACLVHRNAASLPTDDLAVRPLCCGSKSIMTARACRLSHTVHRDY
jgi:hypothetical protein